LTVSDFRIWNTIAFLILATCLNPIIYINIERILHWHILFSRQITWRSWFRRLSPNTMAFLVLVPHRCFLFLTVGV